MKIAHYHILSSWLSLTTDDRRVFLAFDQDYEAFRNTAPQFQVHLAVSVFQKNGGLHLIINDLNWQIGGNQALHCVYHKILDHFHQQLAQQFFLIHASVVARDGQAILIGGPAGAGKSTLTLALTHLGYGFMSDDLAPLDRITGMVNPFPRTLWIADPDGHVSHECLRSGKKPLPAVSFGDQQIRTPQQPKVLLWLTSGAADPEYLALRLTLDPAGEAEILRALQNVGHLTLTCISPHTWQVLMANIPGASNKLKSILLTFDSMIWQAHKEQNFKGDFSRPPKIKPCLATAMAMHLVRELKQAPWQEFQTKSAAAWLMELTCLLSGFSCYELQVGRLSDTLNLVRTLIP